VETFPRVFCFPKSRINENGGKVVETVSSTYILMGRYNHSLSLDATILVSKDCPIIDEHIVSYAKVKIVYIINI